eukprot:Platyproteum_vivax@DN649_c0_g1_i1.p1
MPSEHLQPALPENSRVVGSMEMPEVITDPIPYISALRWLSLLAGFAPKNFIPTSTIMDMWSESDCCEDIVANSPKMPMKVDAERAFPSEQLDAVNEKKRLFEKNMLWRGEWFNLWPRTMLAPLLPDNVRILAVDYESPIFSSSPIYYPNTPPGAADAAAPEIKFSKEMTLAEIGNVMSQGLDLAGVGRNRKVVLIGHSMGGILVKHLLNNHPELQNACKAVVFYATPHFGSPLAEYPSFLSSIVADGVNIVRPRNPQLLTTNSTFEKIVQSKKIKVVSFAETRAGTLLFNLKAKCSIVPKESADPQYGSFFVIPGTTHMESNKPSEPADPRFWLMWANLANYFT